jgi:hypothetical protein
MFAPPGLNNLSELAHGNDTAQATEEEGQQAAAQRITGAL